MTRQPEGAPLLRAIAARPRPVLVASAALVVVGLVLGLGVELRTSRSELAPADDPDQQRWSELLEEYAGSEALVACIEGEDPGAVDVAGRRAFADRFATVAAQDALVAHVFHRVDVDWLLGHALWLAPPETVREVARALGPGGPLGDLAEIRGLADLNQRLAARIERGLAEGASPDETGEGAEGWLGAFLAGQRELLEAPEALTARITAAPPQRALAAAANEQADGYLETRDGATTFAVITPRGADDSLEYRRELVRKMRALALQVGQEFPGYRVAFTGQPALVVEEMDAVRSDTIKTSLLAAAGVALLTLLVFRWRTHAGLVLAALAAGIVWAFGAVKLELGYLNLITSSFVSTLVGVGVAYGIHPVSEYELCGAHTVEPRSAVLEAYRRTAPGVVVAAVTTAAAFFSILLMRFRGFAELGLVAGVGVLLCLAAAMVTLPALLVVYGSRRRRRDRDARAGAAVDRVWIERFAGRVTRYPRTVAIAALAITVLAAVSATGLRFETNILDLLPEEAESLRYQRRMVLESDLTPLYNLVVADDRAALEELAERAAAEPRIARFESVMRFLPADATASAEALSVLGPRVANLRLTERPEPIDPARLATSLGRLEAALAEAGEAAFVAGLAEMAGSLEQARAEAEAARTAVIGVEPGRAEAWDSAQHELLAWLNTGLDWLRDAASVEAPTLETLPAELRQRFVTSGGRLLGLLYPAVDVFEPESLAEYVAASRRVDVQATGFPLLLHKMSGRIVAGFNVAVAAGAVIVLVILLLDFRSLRNAALAMVPLVMGTIWMLGAMRLAGLSFNFANLVAVPLIIGIGIDNGVHVIHRVGLEGERGMSVVLRHTGRAILIASLTTMIGFGSLSLAAHRGLASLGLVLLFGVGSCLVTSTLVLPNLLVVAGRVSR